jgi:hypothetical protein
MVGWRKEKVPRFSAEVDVVPEYQGRDAMAGRPASGFGGGPPGGVVEGGRSLREDVMGERQWSSSESEPES